ncbi:hypothetical protein NPX13_g9194 [Xylaria arbuscula]|uniref:Uncharacterized protein n=1 Tax=Xylaria arbuscula TaxID=114810 RepID=A0A9W8N713_9PEZI|nr:hypothetical protein NPX13_g9194 [Xylaria arbuscula]
MPTATATANSPPPSPVARCRDGFVLSDKVLAKAQHLFNRMYLPIRSDEEFDADAKLEAINAYNEEDFLHRMKVVSESYPPKYQTQICDASDYIHGDPAGVAGRDEIFVAVHDFVQGPMTYGRLADLFASLYRPSQETKNEPSKPSITYPKLEERNNTKEDITRPRRRHSSQTTNAEQRKRYHLRSFNQANRIEKTRKTRGKQKEASLKADHSSMGKSTIVPPV